MIKSIFIFVISLAFAIGQTTLLNRMKIVDPNPYFFQVLQETFYEVEQRGWSSFRLADFTQQLNEITHTNMLVTGNVSYSNGFLVSIEKIDLNAVSTFISHPLVDGVPVTTATVRGTVNLRDARVGYDAVTNITSDNGKQRRYTGIFTHTLIQGIYHISRNMNTNETSVAYTNHGVSGGSGVRMVYLPTDEISEILSLRFEASSSFTPTRNWFANEIQAILLDVATNKVPFPEVCFNC
ncbi:uncharacterized protein LOC135080354 isoform X1 [Ostrinia nubilalis]|uniref:uncharacterized protein LOC135080354 isoform X1 n=2 Tax=Ostrinia nubilalis TaxID=29057 RepID=UPI0030823F93